MSDDERFEAGDEVEREITVFDPVSKKRRGIVTRCYEEGKDYPELYEVTWYSEDGRPIEPLKCGGYLRHGLTRYPSPYDRFLRSQNDFAAWVATAEPIPIVCTEEQFEAFMAALDAPPKVNERLRALLRHESVLDAVDAHIRQEDTASGAKRDP